MNALRIYLQDELARRTRKNPKFSLRAFAKMIGMSPAALSEILNDRRPITAKMATRLGVALALSPAEMKRLSLSSFSAAEPASARKSRKTLKTKAVFQHLPEDEFAVISDWHHYALLELMQTTGFKSDPAWAAKKLGLTPIEVRSAVDRLIRLGMVEMDAKGKWREVRSDGFMTNITQGHTSVAHRRLQKQILEQSLTALESVNLDKRNHTSMTMAIDPARLPEAIERIKKFRRELAELFDSDKNKQSVYQLSVSMFPISKED